MDAQIPGRREEGIPRFRHGGGVMMASIATARATRPMLQRCSTIGLRGGARARNVPSRSRGSRFMNARSWVGLATPRVAANASDSSAGVK